MLESDISLQDGTEGKLQQIEVRQSLAIWDPPESLKIERRLGDPGKPVRVLLAEDNPLDQISIRRLLEKHGFTVVLAPDGRRAVDMYEAGNFDLVLLDILMPEMDGFEVAVRIRGNSQEGGNHIPVIALTAYSLKAVYDKCRSVGMNGYLSKPVSAHDLRMLCSVLMPESTTETSR